MFVATTGRECVSLARVDYYLPHKEGGFALYDVDRQLIAVAVEDPSLCFASVLPCPPGWNCLVYRPSSPAWVHEFPVVGWRVTPTFTSPITCSHMNFDIDEEWCVEQPNGTIVWPEVGEFKNRDEWMEEMQRYHSRKKKTG